MGRMSPTFPATVPTDIAGWSAPFAAGPVTAVTPVPGSKSVTNRAMILAAQADGVSRIGDPLVSRDTALMITALQNLGLGIAEQPPSADRPGSWTVTPGPLRGPVDVDCGLAGTVMRFLPPLAATGSGEMRFDGDPAARRRPMSTGLDALRGLGADIDGAGLPFTLHGTGALRGGAVIIDASASSQFVSGLLLSGPSFTDGVTVHHDGKPVPSLPHIEMTVQLLREHGVIVDDSSPNTWRVEPGPVIPWTGAVEPDLSNATVFLAAAAVTAGTVTVPHWPASTTQPGDAFRSIAERMGCTVTRTPAGLTVTGPEVLQGIDIDLHDVSELTPTIAAMALFAEGPSHLRGIGHIRGHETDRLAALEGDIRGLGGDAAADADALHVTPRPLHGGGWAAHADHRMATAGAVVGLRVPGVVVDDIGCTAKTFPSFPASWATLATQSESTGSGSTGSGSTGSGSTGSGWSG